MHCFMATAHTPTATAIGSYLINLCRLVSMASDVFFGLYAEETKERPNVGDVNQSYVALYQAGWARCVSDGVAFSFLLVRKTK